MNAARLGMWLSLLPLVVPLLIVSSPTPACCPAGPRGIPVVNADQTVIMLWDPATKIQHFIRQASFKSEAQDFGFLVPTPATPELEESGNEAFPYLAKVTAPEIRKIPRPAAGPSCACAAPGMRDMPMTKEAPVRVVSEKRVAGFDAQVLEATSAEALVAWLNERGYDFSPEVEVWAKPYVEQGWKITALKVAKGESEASTSEVRASSLRISFKTERPLFPYREPDPSKAAEGLQARSRLLRIYFLSNARYQGELTEEVRWTGKVAWAGKLEATGRAQLLDQLKLPQETGPAEFWLTEFEDQWPYRAAPADVYFSPDSIQEDVRRDPHYIYVQSESKGDVALLALFALMIPTYFWRRRGTGATKS